MNKEELIKAADKELKSVPDMKKRIRLIDVALKNDTYDMDTIKKLQYEHDKLKRRVNRVVGVIGRLKDESNQRMLCYRYFDGLSYSEIARRIGVKSYDIVQRRIKQQLLEVGRGLYGFEEEFWCAVGLFDH